MVQVVIYLRPTQSELVQQTTFELDNFRHQFQVVRLWEQPTEVFLQLPGLLPYAALTQTSDRVEVLRQVARAIEALPDRRRQSNIAAATGILAGLVLNKDVVRRLLRRELMRESVVYQELVAEIHERVNQEIRQEIREEFKQSKLDFILRLLVRRLKQAVPSKAETQVRLLEIEQLDLLGEALLDFTSLADLEAWLASLAKELQQ